MLPYIRHKLAVLVFGGLIPVYAFHLAYPGGPVEMFNKVTTSLAHNPSSPEIYVTFKAGFNEETKATYDQIGTIIANASADTRVVLSIEENRGGLASMLNAAKEAIAKTSAEVIITIKKFGYSSGTFILGYGDYLKLDYDTLVLFHTGSANGSKITKTPPAWVPPELYPLWERAYQSSLEEMAPYKSWISEEDYEKYKEGEDLFYSGRDLCLGTNGGSAPVLYQIPNGCVIKGFKYREPSFLEKLAMMKFGGY